MNLLIFGPPGSGKGTQSALLVEQLDYKHISTGDLFRSAAKNKTPLGLKAKEFTDKGELVPDSITIDLIKEVLGQNKTQQFILDGFPRNIKQAEALEVLLKGLHKKIDKVLFMEVPKDQLKRRLVGRRVCKNCGTTYHVEAHPTKVANVCDVCGGDVVQRTDDQESVIDKRLDVYEANTAPLKDFYKNKGLFQSIDGLGSETEIFKRINLSLKN